MARSRVVTEPAARFAFESASAGRLGTLPRRTGSGIPNIAPKKLAAIRLRENVETLLDYHCSQI